MDKHKIAYSVQKVKSLNSTTGGLEHREMHNLRLDIPENASIENNENRSIIPLKYNSYVDAYKEKVSEAMKNGSMKYVRKDAVKAAEVVATYTNPDYTKEQLDEWIKETVEFTAKKFGGMDNIINAELHMDESSPHIHFIVIPMKEERLNYKGFIDGPASLSELQDEYSKEVGEKYGLKRGAKYKTYRKAANNYKTLNNFKAATIGKAVMDAKEITEPKQEELRDNGDIIPELYIPRVQSQIEEANFSHLKEINAISSEINSQESDLIGYYLELQEQLKRIDEERQKEHEEEKAKIEKQRLEYMDKLEKLEEFLSLTKGSLTQGTTTVHDITKSLNTQKYLTMGLSSYPDKKKVEKIREEINEIIKYGREQFHEAKDEDIKKIDKMLR